MKTHIIKETKGMALVICLLIMTVAAMLAIGIATDSTIDGQISRNQRYTTKDFFIADGTNEIEVAKILTDDDLAPDNVEKPELLPDSDTDQTLPDLDSLPDPPKFRAKLNYLFRRHTGAGFSIEGGANFKHYYYSTQTNSRRNSHNKTGVKTTEKKLGL